MSEGDAVTTPGVRDSDPLTSTERWIPLYMNVTLTIEPERVGEYLAALREVLPAARAEPNCIYLHAAHPGRTRRMTTGLTPRRPAVLPTAPARPPPRARAVPGRGRARRPRPGGACRAWRTGS